MRSSTAAVQSGLRRLKRRLTRAATVRFAAWDTVEVSLVHGLRTRRYRLDGDRSRSHHGGTLHVEVTSPAELDLLAASGLLQGGIRELRVRVSAMPPWLRGGLRLPRPGRETTLVCWRPWHAGVEISLGWRSKRPISRALAEAGTMLLRPRRLDQAGGPVYAADRAVWRAGGSTWPQAVLDARPAPDHGPFVAPPPGATFAWPLCTAVANPHGRKLSGSATRYTLPVVRPDLVSLRPAPGESGSVHTDVLTFSVRESVESVLARPGWDKYAVIELPEPPGLPDLSDLSRPGGAFTRLVLTGLAACGAVFASRSADVRAQLTALGLASVGDPSDVTDINGYQHSLAASRAALIDADPMLRHTALAGADRLPLPTVSVLIASKRAADVVACLGDIATQNYPSYEVIVGTHGYVLPEDKVAELRERLAGPLRLVPVAQDHTLGKVLGTLSRAADGELLTKVDDDDRYGPDHLTDLLLAQRTSGADLVAKSARFVHLADENVTIDRSWAAVEAFEVMPAGGTMLLSRATLQSCGGWSTSPRHVDADLLTRIRSIGGITYRTHGLGYVYIRRGDGHTWQADSAALRESGERLYDGLPTEVLAGGPLCR